MTKAFNGIRLGLTEALANAKSKATGLRLYQPQAVDVPNLGQRLSLTQEQFAARFGFSVATLRQWERRNHSPSGVSLVLLNVIGLNPEAMFEALQTNLYLSRFSDVLRWGLPILGHQPSQHQISACFLGRDFLTAISVQRSFYGQAAAHF